MIHKTGDTHQNEKPSDEKDGFWEALGHGFFRLLY
jgi:hypothetical protein